VAGHVRVTGVSRVGQGAHDVKQDLLAVAIEISALRHAAPFAARRSPAEPSPRLGGHSSLVRRPDARESAGRPIIPAVSDPIPAWAWVLIEDYVDRSLETRGASSPTARETLGEVARLWPDLSCTILVQEPWQGTVRFKRLLRLRGDEMRPFLDAPETFIRDRFGGGKFKLNIHHGMHFVNTKNFKPEGPPRWQAVPELVEE
jgi:hypothetical protein